MGPPPQWAASLAAKQGGHSGCFEHKINASDFHLRKFVSDEVFAFSKIRKVVSLSDQLVRLLGPDITSQI